MQINDKYYIELLVLDNNTDMKLFNYAKIELLVFHGNTWNHLTVCK